MAACQPVVCSMAEKPSSSVADDRRSTTAVVGRPRLRRHDDVGDYDVVDCRRPGSAARSARGRAGAARSPGRRPPDRLLREEARVLKPFNSARRGPGSEHLVADRRSRLTERPGEVEPPPVEKASSMPTGSPRSTSSYSAGSNESTYDRLAVTDVRAAAGVLVREPVHGEGQAVVPGRSAGEAADRRPAARGPPARRAGHGVGHRGCWPGRAPHRSRARSESRQPSRERRESAG